MKVNRLGWVKTGLDGYRSGLGRTCEVVSVGLLVSCMEGDFIGTRLGGSVLYLYFVPFSARR